MVTHQYQAVCVHSVAAVHGAPSTCCVTCWLESVNVRMGSKVSHVTSVKRGASSRKASACVSKYIRHTHTPHTHRHTLTWDTRLTCSFFISSMWWQMYWYLVGWPGWVAQSLPVFQPEYHCNVIIPAVVAAGESDQRNAGTKMWLSCCSCRDVQHTEMMTTCLPRWCLHRTTLL